MPKEITFYVIFGEKRDPSEIYANSNLRNLTHITKKPSYVYTFFTYTLKEITALGPFLSSAPQTCAACRVPLAANALAAHGTRHT
jgi:hypothetical protein